MLQFILFPSNDFQSFVEPVLRYENFNLTDIFTPVDADKLEQLLIETDYDSEKTKYLVKGFQEGFSLGYEGQWNIKLTAPNLKFQEGVGSETELWNKVMKEVQAKRYAGPFSDIPFQDRYIQSPIGLVPKDGGASTRLIFHLSYPRDDRNLSVNGNTPKELCSVQYPDFNRAIQLCINEGKHCFCSKSDWRSAFRHFPILKRFWNYLVMKAWDPVTRQWFYFVDKCMPFGSSISCAHFQAFSNAISHIMTTKTGKENINYLDDFLFIAFLRWLCNAQTEMFLDLCDQIRFPVSMDKTFWASTIVTFLGMLIDTDKQLIMIPKTKINKALAQINAMLHARRRRTTVLKIQKLCGLLNFLCRAIVPGRLFLMRLYHSLSNVQRKQLKPHHHLQVSDKMTLNLELWKPFLGNPQIYCRPFIDLNAGDDAEILDWYTDAAKCFGKGYGGHHRTHWFHGLWDKQFLEQNDPSIEFLELYAVVVGIILWLNLYPNRRILLFCDNESVVYMINKQSSKCKNCMMLIRIITLQSLICNTRVYAQHVSTRLNGRADVLSRNDVDRFKSWSRTRGIQIDEFCTPTPKILRNIESWWLK